MKPAGGVDDQDVGLAGQGAVAGVVRHARRVGAGGPLTMSAPARVAQTVNWSAAAARKVSQAASRIDFPSSLSRCASLAIEVVLPEPLTPAIR